MMENKKIIAGFELTLMIVSLFAFSYGVAMTDEVFEELDDRYEEARAEKLAALGNLQSKKSVIGVIFDYLTKPMVPVVSAESFGAGCCAVATSGEKCATATIDTCADGATFAEGVLCVQASFCQKGCCFDESLGIFDRNVLESDCSVEWTQDPNCNLPAAAYGCCILGTETIYETEGQCNVDTLTRALGDGVVDWRGDLNELQCSILSATQEVGACVLDGGGCVFESEIDCLSQDGDFNVGRLCTSPLLNTSCEMSEQTTCVEGKDGVSFLDSCGNVANIYDSARVSDPVYWDLVAVPEDVCGDGDVDGGNADSPSCGNCNRFAGGMCSSAAADGFDVDLGEFYCKDTSCMFDGENYKNGESWCVYDGKIGDGDDVVGSRHWKYVCSQGTVQVEPCADYRNQICIQSNTFDVAGEEVEFRNSACVANNWRACIDLNSKEDGLEKCEETLNCRVEKVNIASDFKFDVCTPKYPGGFDLKSEKYQETAAKTCGMATQTCTVVYAPKFAGGCKLVSNGDCLKKGFAEGVNDLCRKLGDCGGEVNIEGEFSENYKVKKSPELNSDWIGKLKTLANPVNGQYAEAEDYSEYLEAAGFFGGSGEVPEREDPKDYSGDAKMAALGVSGLAYAGVMAEVGGAGGLFVTTTSVPAVAATSTTTATPAVASTMAPFAGAAIGAGIGMVAGIMIAKQLGLSGLGTTLMAIGGGVAGLAAGYGLAASAAATAATATAATAAATATAATAAAATAATAATAAVGTAGAATAAAAATTAAATAASATAAATAASAAAASATATTAAANSGWLLGIGPVGWIILAAIALMIIASFFMGSDCDPVEVTFECKPWQPPKGGDDCEKCNGDLLKPCSEYRCNSLGAACELINKGTENELCIDGSVDDTTPPTINTQTGANSPGQIQSDVLSDGFSITSSNGGCIDAYTPLVLGITTDEPTLCKFDIVMNEFDNMALDLGGNFYSYNHTSSFALPDPSHGQSQGINWTGDLTFYIKCQDTKGHESPGFYTVETCVKEGLDKTAPMIRATEPTNYGLLNFDAEIQDITIVTNELSTCKWDAQDVEYSSMRNSMTCEDSLASPSNVQGYVCTGELPVGNSSNNYYIRCADQPWLGNSSERNANVESFVYTIRKPEAKISIEKMAPNVDFETNTVLTTIDLKIETANGGDYHFCSYSFSGYDRMIKLFETGTEKVHVQPLNRPAGHNKIYVECEDETGDFARSETEFNIIRDTSTPVIARVWQDGGAIHVVTTEAAECKYSTLNCRFDWDDATSAGSNEEHVIGVVRGETYFIKCEDEFGNRPSGCSIEVRAL